jgi:LPS-assembly lipoprotein
MYQLTGGGQQAAPTHRLDIHLSSREIKVIVDISTARPDVENFGIDAKYQLIDLRTGKPVVSGQTFSRVSYNIPGQEQRFAGTRGLRDAEDRAAKVIADNIHSRLASFFVAGS